MWTHCTQTQGTTHYGLKDDPASMGSSMAGRLSRPLRPSPWLLPPPPPPPPPMAPLLPLLPTARALRPLPGLLRPPWWYWWCMWCALLCGRLVTKSVLLCVRKGGRRRGEGGRTKDMCTCTLTHILNELYTLHMYMYRITYRQAGAAGRGWCISCTCIIHVVDKHIHVYMHACMYIHVCMYTCMCMCTCCMCMCG